MIRPALLAALLLAAGSAQADAPCVPGTTGPGACQPKQKPRPAPAPVVAPAPAPAPIPLPGPGYVIGSNPHAAAMGQAFAQQQQDAAAWRKAEAECLLKRGGRALPPGVPCMPQGGPVRQAPEPSSFWLVVIAGLCAGAARTWRKR